jgi:DNA topoisomerase IA
MPRAPSPCACSGGKGSTITSLGRVQTPTLAIIVEREQKILEFKPREFHELEATFGAAAGQYPGRWFDEQFSKEESELDRTRRSVDAAGFGRSQRPQLHWTGWRFVVG